MNVFVYSDESGVFDRVHNDYFVFGGLILLGKEERDLCNRKYKKAEHDLRPKYGNEIELKAWNLGPKDRTKLFRSLNQYIKFGVIIDQQRVYERIFHGKKDKQRYLDYAYKIGLRNAFECIIKQNPSFKNEVERLIVHVDEHTTATLSTCFRRIKRCDR